MRHDETQIEGNLATVIVRNDDGTNPARNQGELYLALEGELEGEVFTGVDANELRDAIDKAVGKREEEIDWRDSDRVEVDWLEGRIIVDRETVGIHAGRWMFPSGRSCGVGAVANRNPKAVPASTPKPYRPVDLSDGRNQELTLLLELWGEQRRLGASDEALAATRSRIERHIKKENA